LDTPAAGMARIPGIASGEPQLPRPMGRSQEG
jgi:hypothetical protein